MLVVFAVVAAGAIGVPIPVSVTLDRPLGDRVLVDVVSGGPILKF